MPPRGGQSAPRSDLPPNFGELLEAEGLPAPPFWPPAGPAAQEGCAVLAWARSGAMALTGRPDGPPRWPEGPVAHRVGELVLGVGAFLGTERSSGGALAPGPLLTGRAAERGLRRRGQLSAGGHSRLLVASDGWVAVSLPRSSDIELLEAALGCPVGGDPWALLARVAPTLPAAELVARIRFVGLAAAVLPEPGARVRRAPVVVRPLGQPGPVADRAPLVVDLTAMWAGPLCAHLLGRSGARVIKVEDPARPDGARQGDRALFDRLHAGHQAVALELSSASGRRTLAALVEAADVVLEASRPRALEQLGIDAEGFVAGRPGRTWVSITGYGRQGPGSHWVAFGDDAAVAGGLVAWDHSLPVFCADALADPLSGLVAAAAALASRQAGGGHLLDVAMEACAAFAASGPPCPFEHSLLEGPRGRWRVAHGEHSAEVAPPHRVLVSGRGPALGADTRAVLEELAFGMAG